VPPRIVHLADGVSALGSSSARRASVSFAPATTEHLFAAAADHDDTDGDAAVGSSRMDDDLALIPMKLSVPPPPPPPSSSSSSSSSSSASLARIGRGAVGSNVNLKAMLDSADDHMVCEHKNNLIIDMFARSSASPQQLQFRLALRKCVA
jgi:hypothetical protein